MHKERLLSLDVFRGLLVVGMLMVDNPGSWDIRLPIFEHAHWNGFTPPDFIFPSFIFAMGMAMAFSLGQKNYVGSDKVNVYKSIIIRSVGLFIIGYIVNICYHEGPYSFSTIRLLGVLQRFSIVYLIVSICFLHFNLKKLIILGCSILLGYWALLSLIPVPGYGMPDLTVFPDKITPNIAVWLDYKLLGTKAWVYSRPYDPEGIISNLPSISTAILGIAAGRWLKSERTLEHKALGIIVSGIGLVILGGIWNYWFPINKQLWTSSFVLFAGGLSMMVFGTVYWILDGLKKKLFINQFFSYFGTNALLAFCMIACVDAIISAIPVGGTNLKNLFYSNTLANWLPEIHASWIYSIIVLGLYSLLFRYLYHRKIIIKL
ncbi:MAG: DUF5009 domain-containing protein [Bacteroidales bacterium]|nr:MAG: DUF5009 domain-containing protein [Bacteroidales bacterium]